MATYVNDLRLKEIATGDEAGTWGTSTNTNLELIAEAFSFGTEAITTNADTHTTTIADGSTDPGRSIFLKYTGTLDSACTITIGPNTVSKLWLIENATSGSQTIIIKQGSGATITVPNGQTKAIYSDGAGSGGAMVDAFQDLSIPDLFIDDDLTFTSDSAVITFGADGDTTLTHTDGTGLTLNSTNKLTFGDVASFVQQSSDGVLRVDGEATIDLNASTAVTVSNDLKLDSDSAVLGFGADNDTTLTHTDGSGLTLNSTNKIMFNDASQFIQGSSATVLSLGATDEIDLTATLIDINGNADVSGTVTATGTSVFASLDISGDIDVDGTTNLDVVDIDGALTQDGGAVFNEASADVDFRVESNGNTHMLFVDAGNDFVGIGNSTQWGGVLNVTSSDNGNTLVLASTDTDANVGPILSLYRSSSSSAADSDFLGRIALQGLNDANQAVTYGKIFAQIADASDGTEDGILAFRTVLAGTDTRRIDLGSTETVINEDSANLDFRVESDGNANMLFVDAGDNRVGVGISPTETLHVDGRSRIQNLYLGEISSNFDIVQATSSAGLYLVAGTSNVTLGTSGFIFNEGGADTDFRVESDANTHALFVDAGNNSLGIFNSADTDMATVALGLTGVAISGDTDGATIGKTGIASLYNLNNHSTTDATIMLLGGGSAGALSGQISSGFGFARHSGASWGTQIKMYVHPDDTVDVDELHEAARVGPNEFVINETSNDYDFRVESNSFTNMLVVNAGLDCVGVGTTGTSARFTTAQSSATPITGYFHNTASTITNTSGSILYLQTSGDSAIQDGYKMVTFADSDTVLGTISTAASSTNVAYNTSSDERLKESIVDMEPQLDKVLAAKPRQFDWKKNGLTSQGFIAQELHEVFPEAVTVGGEDPTESPWSVDYGRITPFLMKAIQEQQEQIEELKAEIAKLKGE